MSIAGAGSEISIDGLAPGAVATPESAAELAAVLRGAAQEGATVVPFGGATALGLGNVPVRVDLAVATGGLGRVFAYEPSDLTLSVEAGATVAAIQERLGQHGQELPIDVPFPERATIGGVVATGYAGPRRLRDGTLRDLLIGASFAQADGALASSGGMVVKNVSGFDLARLMHGALGTLGVLTSLNLRVLPRAQADRTLLVASDPERLTDAALAACRLPLRPTSAELLLDGGAAHLALRLRGRELGVSEQARELEDLLTRHGLKVDVHVDGGRSGEWWQSFVDHWGEERSATAQFLLKVRPRHVPALVTALEAAVQRGGDGAEAVCSVGLGAARLNLPVPSSDVPPWLHTCQQRWLGEVDDAVVEFAPAEAKRGLDVWGRPPSALAVMQALKRELDPSAALNRGRFVSFL